MRLLRIPYVYFPDCQVAALHVTAHRLLAIISCIHNDIPNEHHRDLEARHYQYYPSFVRWVHDKAAGEMVRRKLSHKSPLTQDILDLKSRSISNFLPPTDIEIAEDVVYVLQKWKYGRYPGGVKLPETYVQLAEKVYGYTPDQVTLEGIGKIPGHHYHHDSGWYHV